MAVYGCFKVSTGSWIGNMLRLSLWLTLHAQKCLETSRVNLNLMLIIKSDSHRHSYISACCTEKTQLMHWFARQK